jgi:phosphoribosyl-AMP cyclohydrolase
MRGVTPDMKTEALSDAILMARYILASDLNFESKQKYTKYAETRWEVWKKGYALLICDEDGVPYVYAKKEDNKNPIRNLLRRFMDNF